MSKEARQFAAILKSWGPTLQRAVSKANSHRWPSGAPGGKGGQFAPGSKGGGTAPYSTSKAGFQPKQMSLFSLSPKAPQLDAGKPKQEDYGAFGKPMGSWGSWGEPMAPKAPPPGAKPHPQMNDKGEPVTINYPTKPSAPDTWKNPDATATFTPGSAVPAVLNGVPLKPWKAPERLHEWADVAGQRPEIDKDFPLVPKPGMSVGAGVIIEEPDGRIWLTKPTNHFGGYMQTFPKGTAEHGLSLQASAIKEAYEETGLKIEITGVLGDYERTTSVARFYTAKRVGGTPADMGWESQAVRLATPRDLGKLLNSKIDKGILDAYQQEHFLKRAPLSLVRNFAMIDQEVARRGLDWLYKAGKSDMLHGKAGHWQHQERWPAGTPLGGQWKAMGADGLTLPPTIAGGLAGANPAYQKKVNAIHALAQSGDHSAVLDAAILLEKKVKADTAAGKKSTHVKWNAQASQYVSQLVADILVKPKAEASADKISGPEKLSDYKKVGEKPGGSNDGAKYADKDGVVWLVKGNNYASTGGMAMSDDRAKNEVLATKLMAAAGIPGPEMKLVDLEGKHQGNLGVAVKWIDGLQKFNPNDAGQLAAVQNQFAVHAWLGNWDVLGMQLDNVMFKDGSAVNIDPGGSILFRAQGAPKAAGVFDKSASDWESMRSTDQHQKSVFGSMTASQLQDSAKHLANISDDTINKLVDVYGPGDLKAKVELAATLRARRDAILSKAGVTSATVKLENGPTVKEPEPAPAPVPPKIVDAVPAPAGTALPPGVEKPTFNSGYDKTDTFYASKADQAEALHKAGDLAGLKALADTKKNPGTWAGSTNSSKKLQAFHSALVADLEGKQQQAAAQVSAGQATVTDAKGQEWKATDGVLNPVSNPAPITPASIAQKDALAAEAVSMLPQWKENGGKDKQAVQANLWATNIAATYTGQNAAGLTALSDKITLSWANGQISDKQYQGLMEAKEKLSTKLAASLLAPAAPAAASVTALPQRTALAILNETHGGTYPHEEVMASDGASKAIYVAALAGDIKAAEAVQPEPWATSAPAFKAAVLEAMQAKSGAAAPATSSEPTPAPVSAPAPAPAPAPALPDFEAAKKPLTNTNAATHNPKVDLIAKLAKAGDVKGLLALNFGSNTYAGQQVKLTNDALAALGSPHKVTKKQAANSHPALVNGSVQNAPVTASVQPLKEPAAAPAAAKPAFTFKPELLSTPPSFTASAVPAVNQANNEAAKAIYDAAIKGSLHAVQNLKFEQLDKATQQKTGVLLSFDQHPSKAVQAYYGTIQDEVNEQITGKPSGPTPGAVRLNTEWKSISEATKPVAMGAGVKAVPDTKKIGFYIVLGKAPSMPSTPTVNTIMGKSNWGKWAVGQYQKASDKAKKVFSHYITTSGAGEINNALRFGDMDGKLDNGMGKKEYVDLFNKELAIDIPEGAKFSRSMGTHGYGGKSLSSSQVQKMISDIEKAGPGTVLQEPGFSSSSHGGGILGGNEIQWQFTAGQGVKAFPAWLTENKGEQECLFPPNTRYLVRGFKKEGGKFVIDALLLPSISE